jgi:hypothetical protein
MRFVSSGIDKIERGSSESGIDKIERGSWVEKKKNTKLRS